MTTPLKAEAVARQVAASFPQALAETRGDMLWVHPQYLLEVARSLKETPDLQMDYLVAVTGVDYLDYFEVVYHLVSLAHNHSLVLKTRVLGRAEPTVPSLYPLYQGADLQEREVYDLMGIRFAGHPNLKRVLLWEGFPGHPLRRDYLEARRPNLKGLSSNDS